MAKQQLLVLSVASCKVLRIAVQFFLFRIMTEYEYTSSLSQNEAKFSYQIIEDDHGFGHTPLWIMAVKKVPFLSEWKLATTVAGKGRLIRALRRVSLSSYER